MFYFFAVGVKWRNLRQTLSPLFTSKKMKTMYVLMENCTDRLINYLNDRNEGVIEVELENLIKRYCMDVIATTAFGIETDSVAQKENEFFNMGVELTDFTGLKRFKFLSYGGVITYLTKVKFIIFHTVFIFFVKWNAILDTEYENGRRQRI